MTNSKSKKTWQKSDYNSCQSSDLSFTFFSNSKYLLQAYGSQSTTYQKKVQAMFPIRFEHGLPKYYKV